MKLVNTIRLMPGFLTVPGCHLQRCGDVPELLQHRGRPAGKPRLQPVSASDLPAVAHSQAGAFHATAAAATLRHAAHDGQRCHIFFSPHTVHIHI